MWTKYGNQRRPTIKADISEIKSLEGLNLAYITVFICWGESQTVISTAVNLLQNSCNSIKCDPAHHGLSWSFVSNQVSVELSVTLHSVRLITASNEHLVKNDRTKVNNVKQYILACGCQKWHLTMMNAAKWDAGSPPGLATLTVDCNHLDEYKWMCPVPEKWEKCVSPPQKDQDTEEKWWEMAI